MTTVYIHIGRGKTGTTAIQRTMSQHRDYLLSCGVHYIYADDMGSGSGHQNFAKSFIPIYPNYMIPPSAPAETRKKVAAEIAESRSPKILLSSENFTLCDLLSLQCFLFEIPTIQRIKIIFFVRSQDELAESQYNQMVKMTDMTMPFRLYIEDSLGETDYYDIASEWAAVFGEENLICRVYDAGPRDVVKDFLTCVKPGMENPNGSNSNEGVINESVGYFQLRMLLSLNQFKLDIHPWIATQTLMRLSKKDFPALLFNVEEAGRYRARFASSNERFSSRFLTARVSDLGGRKYSDDERRAIRRAIQSTTADESFNLLGGPDPTFAGLAEGIPARV